MKLFFVWSLFLNIVLPCLATYEFIAANTLFSGAVYTEISKSTPSNFLVSPLSIEIALAFIETGCRGESAEEIRNALYLPDDTTTIEQEIKDLLYTLSVVNKRLYTFHMVNKVYVAKDFQLRPEFKKTAREIYDSYFQNLNFFNTRKAAKTINKWVEHQTNNKIRKLIDANTLTLNTKMVLVNAIYFKAKWSRTFPRGQTTLDNFYVDEETAISVQTMHHFGKYFNYYESVELDAKFLEMPLNDEDANMVIVLPNELDGLQLLEEKVYEVLEVGNFTLKSLNVALPKFRVQMKIHLDSLLQRMGIRQIFSNTAADLSGIAGGKGDLVVNDAIQKCFVNVSEGGLEAAAATAAVATWRSLEHSSEEPEDFVVDRPFMFYVKIQGLVVFIGRVLDPRP